MLKTHYRSPMDWTVKGLEESKKTLAITGTKVVGDDTAMQLESSTSSI